MSKWSVFIGTRFAASKLGLAGFYSSSRTNYLEGRKEGND